MQWTTWLNPGNAVLSRTLVRALDLRTRPNRRSKDLFNHHSPQSKLLRKSNNTACELVSITASSYQSTIKERVPIFLNLKLLLVSLRKSRDSQRRNLYVYFMGQLAKNLYLSECIYSSFCSSFIRSLEAPTLRRKVLSLCIYRHDAVFLSMAYVF